MALDKENLLKGLGDTLSKTKPEDSSIVLGALNEIVREAEKVLRDFKLRKVRSFDSEEKGTALEYLDGRIEQILSCFKKAKIV